MKLKKTGTKKGYYVEEDEQELRFKDIKITYDPVLEEMLYKNKWQKVSLEDAIFRTVAESVTSDDIEIDFELPDVKHNPGVMADFTVTVTHRGETYDLPAHLLFTIAPKRAKEGTQYFEGILQLRDCDQEVIDFAHAQVDKSNAAINEEKQVPGGVDLYITEKNYMRRLGEKLKTTFNGELKESPQHFSYNPQESKNIYRLNVLFRQHAHKTGDVIQYQGNDVRITKIGRNIQGIDLKTGKRILVKKDYL